MSARPWRPRPFLGASFALHVAGGALVVWRPELIAPTIVTLLADQAIIAASGLVPRSALVDHNLSRVRGETQAPSVVLTFDDGPDPRTTPRVLEALREARAHASFFCIGERLEAYPGLARQIVGEGHRLENHTYAHHHLFGFHGPRRLARDIGRAQEVIESVSGRRARWFRAPAGIRSPWLDPVLHGLGLRLVSWTRRGYDALSRDADSIRRRLERGIFPGAILLLHDGASLRGSETAVLDVLPRLLASVGEAGLTARALRDEEP